MDSILVIRSSSTGAASVSNTLIDGLVARIAAEEPGVAIVEHDLDSAPVPHIRADALSGLGRGGPVTDAAHEARILSDKLIGEVKAARAIVIGAPMYNFGINSTLKSWFDHVLRAGETFQYTAAGPEGLVASKPVIVIETRAGVYSSGPMTAYDSQEPHLKAMLGFMGLTDVEFVRVEGLAMGEAEVKIAAAADALAGVGLGLAEAA
ncbi:NAD(P)H-dependent oxidoreductase [Sphingomonas naphthae]|uniref:FMN dependent NADH:quinone oxidoreductase n=1 Tax=Sphingomonas naphthae TaxID=1813468 RepID=A0ABY7TGM6_9SPHN|nr:NAD(P)H-dependent oxidoreductase [Sphingomonas naphthae]WCT71993.1 NAD(P)H-dependent oxidoreductase [Sphingomonas naphthae]